ncbi:MAG: DUF4430 domain-containing protein [Methanomassiliicoccales archaeon]|jgi:hypothetical protein|nr:DUF4430 domain-containing protein [Methanomassiliicoccales archaeon]
MSKLKRTDLALIAIVIVIIVIIAVFAFPDLSGSEDDVTTDLSIDFVDTAAPIHPGNITTWEMVSGEWQATTVENSGHSVWTFKNITSGSNCYLQLMEAASIADFAVGTQNQTLGLLVTSIADLTNQVGGGPGWQFYLNGVYGNRACNMISIANGDSVEWKYTPLAG